MNVNVQVTGRPAVLTGLSFASETELHSIIDPGGNLNFQCAGTADDAMTSTVGTLVTDAHPTPAARRTGRLNAKESLRLDHLSPSVAIVAFHRLRPGFCTRTIAGHA